LEIIQICCEGSESVMPKYFLDKYQVFLLVICIAEIDI